MKIKDLKRLLNKCNDELEIGINDFDAVYEIEGISTILYGVSGIDGMMYVLRPTKEIDDVVEVSTSLIKNLKIMQSEIKKLGGIVIKNEFIKKAIELILSNEKALEIIELELNSMPQNEDGDVWAYMTQAAKIAGILNIAYFDNLKFEEIMKDGYFEDDYTGGNIVVGIENDDGTTFTEPIEGKFYLELFAD